MYKQVDGFDSKPANSCQQTDCKSGYTLYKDKDGTCSCFYYPDANKTQYLYQSYPNIISPLEGVTNEHFMVWMRVESLPNFRKLYGKISGPFHKGDTIYFDIESNFEVTSYGGTKTLVLSSLGSLGGQNPYPSIAFKVTGSLSVIVGAICLGLELKMRLSKRR